MLEGVVSIVTLTMNPAIDIAADVAQVLPTHKLRCTSVRRDPGGGGINVARVIARLGGDVRAVFPVGGQIGDLLRGLVDAENISSETISLSQDTRESFTVEESKTGQQYRFLLPGPELTHAECRNCLAAVAQMLPAPTFFVMSGGLPAGVPDDFVARAAQAAKALGAKVVVDTSGPALAAALKEGVFLVKPNLREMQELVGSELSRREQQIMAARGLIERGAAEAVALTLGQHGGLLVTRQQAQYAPGLPVEPVSTVGAGDSFLGAMIWSLAAGQSIENAFRYGMAAGSAALLSAGTQLCKADDVLRLHRQVHLQPV
jgi:6-phosphofructokinase 2